MLPTFVLMILFPYLAIALFALLCGRRLSVKPGRISEVPSVSVVIPTYNEEKRIESKLQEVYGLDYEKRMLEVVVVDESSDSTMDIVRRWQQDRPALKLIHNEQRVGIATALDTAYGVANGDVIIKTDCDSKILSKDAIMLAVSYLARPDVGGLTGIYAPREGGESQYRSLLHMLQTAESNVWSTSVAHGCFTVFKKNLYEAVAANSLADDTEIFVGILGKGKRAIIVPEIVAVEDNPLSFKRLLEKRSRRAQGIIRVFLSSKGRRAIQSGPYGFLTMALEGFLILVSPFVLLIFAALISLYLINSSAYGSMLSIIAIALVAGLWAHRRNPIASFFDAQLAAAIGTIKCLRPASGIYDRIQ